MKIETRVANRAKSIFAAFGQIVNDFYLEAGIYFVGAFNAALVAWDILTTLISNGQPHLYAITLAIIAFIAVEGLAVYLVGAAAKTNNGLLWFFSIIFAGFFTYAHLQEMTRQSGIISQYITLAIPFFVVVGYWARTLKVETEQDQALAAQERMAAMARKQRLEDEERERQRQIEDEERAHKLAMAAKEAELKHAEKLARIEAKSAKQTVSQTVSQTVPQVSQEKTIETLKKEIIAELSQEKPNLTQLASRLDVSRSTLYRHLGTLAGTGEIKKNGNGYEVNGK